MQSPSAPPRSLAARLSRLPAPAATGVMALPAVLLAASPTWLAPKSAPALVSSAFGRCLGVKGEADTPGTALEIRDCGDQAARPSSSARPAS
ncbi:hypothetical protein [Streptomyces acidiscabies]|uniref:hypothetical protein n=1 Tax=Streptomyces acidiscabies TaxID=42234 RepID=UPI0038F7AA0D